MLYCLRDFPVNDLQKRTNIVTIKTHFNQNHDQKETMSDEAKRATATTTTFNFERTIYMHQQRPRKGKDDFLHLLLVSCNISYLPQNVAKLQTGWHEALTDVTMNFS